MKVRFLIGMLLIISSSSLFAQDDKAIKYNPFNYKPFAKEFYYVDKNGKTAKAGGIYFDEQENRYFILSRSFLDQQTHVFINKTLKASKVEDLKKQRIGVVRGGYAQKYFEKNYPSFRLVIFDNYDKMMDAALLNRIMTFADSTPDVYFTLSQNNALKYFRQIRLQHKEEEEKKQETDTSKLAQILKADIEKLVESKIKTQEKILTKTQFRFYLWGGIGLFVLAVLIIVVLWLVIKLRKSYSPVKDVFKKNIAKLLDSGEGEFLELKSSLRYDFKLDQNNPLLESVIAKSICAFLNSNGGIILIGFSDTKEVLGLECDYKTLGKKQNQDGFLLRLKEVINQYLGREFHNYILCEILSYQEKEICKISIKASRSPVFFHCKNKEEFYIRSGSSSQPLSLKESFEYIKTHYNK